MVSSRSPSDNEPDMGADATPEREGAMKKDTVIAWTLAAAAIAAPSLAQDHSTMHHEHHDSPYAAQESSGISSLSQQEHDDLLAGAGMGFARLAELNRYPGPKHVLELAVELELSATQRSRVEAIRLAMLDEARRLGEEIVARERHLDMRFANRHIDDAKLRAATAEIAKLYGELRFAHLRAHLETRTLLTAAQIEGYDRLRGY